MRLVTVISVVLLSLQRACGYRPARPAFHVVPRSRWTTAATETAAASAVAAAAVVTPSSKLKMVATAKVDDPAASAAALTEHIHKATADSPKLQFDTLFRAFATSEYFANHVWQKQPHYVNEPLACAVGAYTMDDVRQAVDSDFLEAGRGTFQEGRGGWNMATVSTVSGMT